ncbi:NHLP leader peptide family RiPP precursor [Paenibacillus sepulcri]|uniref:NHLP leader peptide family RiPP n=1 Tax=Paenibacillus sepulcri TaxID=359917 RepID=A0ABS7BY60_9BACL|nr:NHLP leader peptide family RiPP precursor [Paenibacillus sepulcri]
MTTMVEKGVLQEQIIERAWNDAEFKRKLLADPRTAIQEAFNLDVPAAIQLTTLEETQSHFYLIIPPNPADSIKQQPLTEEIW